MCRRPADGVRRPRQPRRSGAVPARRARRSADGSGARGGDQVALRAHRRPLTHPGADRRSCAGARSRTRARLARLRGDAPLASVHPGDGRAHRRRRAYARRGDRARAALFSVIGRGLRAEAARSGPRAARAGAGAELGGPPQVPRGCRRARQAGAAALPLAEHRAGAVHRAQPPRAHSRRGGPVRRRAAGERRGRGQAGGGRRMALRVPERGRHSRAVARARGGRRHDRARRYAQDLPHRADRIRVRSCRGLVRHRRRVPRARGAAGCPARAHRLVERRSVARRCARGPGAPHRGGARVGMTCVVVGAGLTGLSAAWELIRAGTEVIVLESERRAGGVVVTERREGFIVEGGPDGFLAAEPDIQALARELGIGDRLVGSLLEANGVVLTVPTWVAARLLAAVGVPGARELDDVVYAPSVTASLAYRRDQLNGRLDGSGFVRAADTGGVVRACTYAWLKYPDRAPAGYALLRAFLEPADGDPAALAHRELASVLGLSGPPLLSRVFHWRRGLPRYKPGHAERVAHVRERLARLAPLDIAGAGFDGVGVSACVKSGREAAQRVLGRLGVDPGAPPRSQPSPGRSLRG